jgi:dipeptidyl aminopeptidase/acylaminoacyl peptidase
MFLNEQLNNYYLSETEIIKYESFDGYKISSYLNMPAHDSILKEVPLVVIPHDDLFEREYNEFEPFSQFFTSKGFAVMRINFRGSAGLGKEHLLSGTKMIVTNKIEDIASGVNYVIKNKNIDATRIYIIGNHYGGYAAYISVIKYPSYFKAAVVINAPTYFPAIIDRVRNSYNTNLTGFWKSIFESNYDNEEYLKSISPCTYINKINIPMLIYHHESDNEFPIKQSYRVEDEAIRYNKDIKLKVFDSDDKKNIWSRNKFPLFLNEVVTFFNEVK